MDIPTPNQLCDYLWSLRLKATPGRLALLEILSKERQPLSVSQIHEKVKLSSKGSPQKSLDDANIYRTLIPLVDAGIVHRSDWGDAHSYYELAYGRKHHHHIVCTKCGHIEDVQDCSLRKSQQSILKFLKDFKYVYSHSLEFFGLCKKCDTPPTMSGIIN